MTIRTDPVMEHAVVVSLRVGGDGATQVPDRLMVFVDRIAAELDSVPGGEFGGMDARAGYCMLYCYGRDAGQVYAVVEPLLAEYGPAPGSWAIKRFGAATDLTARRERVDLA